MSNIALPATLTLGELRTAYIKIKTSVGILKDIPNSQLTDLEFNVEVSEDFAFRVREDSIGLEYYYKEHPDDEGEFRVSMIRNGDVRQAMHEVAS